MKNKTTRLVMAALGVILFASLLLMATNTEGQISEGAETIGRTDLSTVDTWEKYQALSPEDQEAFYQQFGSAEAFEAWMDSVKPAETTLPIFLWDKEGKLPDAYTWEEYQALSLEDQEAFYQWFETEAAFELWLGTAKAEGATEPVLQWDKEGKQPNQYTWEEYQALTSQEQEAFFHWFETEAAFEAWLKKAQPADATSPVTYWNKPGKSPREYTWEEYQALTAQEQEEFYRWFGSKNSFESWMKEVKPVEPTEAAPTWNKAGKTPDQYTWAEYKALTNEEQDAFYSWFGSESAFAAWMDAAIPTEDAETELSWNKSGKQPDAYTWAEYQALTAQEKDAFYNWFGSMEGFEAWMNSAKPQTSDSDSESWNKSGKQPDVYTWEEYQALNPQDQELFYKWFGSAEAFEAWMDGAKDAAEKSWNKTGKLPDQYTKEEYLALTAEEQEAFFLWFDTTEDFEAWVEWAEKQG